MIQRLVLANLVKYLTNSPSVALLGARQVGKTTLAKTFVDNDEAIYLDLESPEDLLKLSDPLSFFELHNDKLIIIDEIQRSPELFQVLRGVIDKNRSLGKEGKQFLFLGSASMDLLRQTSESLAGRIRYLEMQGLNIQEVEGNNNQLWFRGGFPNSYLSCNDEEAMLWLENLIRTYLERDVPQMGFRVPAMQLRRLWTMLAHMQGETVNYSKLGASLDMDSKSVAHYIGILTDLLLVRKLMPWHGNVKKRLVKSPRYYVRDSGILHRLLGIHNHDALLSNPIVGKSWEGFVIENIYSVLPQLAETYFFRTATGVEIDLVIKFSATETWAIEIKFGRSPKITDSFHKACEDINASHKFIVYGGDDEFPIKDGAMVISLNRLIEKIKAR